MPPDGDSTAFEYMELSPQSILSLLISADRTGPYADAEHAYEFAGIEVEGEEKDWRRKVGESNREITKSAVVALYAFNTPVEISPPDRIPYSVQLARLFPKYGAVAANGLLLTTDGFVLTNAHIMESFQRFDVAAEQKHGDGYKSEKNKMAFGLMESGIFPLDTDFSNIFHINMPTSEDVGLLRILVPEEMQNDDFCEGPHPTNLRFSASGGPREGEKVYIMGYDNPRLIQGRDADSLDRFDPHLDKAGYVLAETDIHVVGDETVDTFIIAETVEPGHSGSVVANEDGEIVGIVSSLRGKNGKKASGTICVKTGSIREYIKRAALWLAHDRFGIDPP